MKLVPIASFFAVSSILGLALGGCTTGGKSDDSRTLRGGSGSSNNGSHGGSGGTNNTADAATNPGGSQNGAGESGQGTGGSNDDAGSAGTSPGGTNGSPDSGTGGSLSVIDAGQCNAQTQTHAFEGATHVVECSAVNYLTNPPSSGNHYGTWAAFGVYEFPLPRGYWMHNMEHGAVVITYNCPDGCDADLQAAIEWFNALPVDPACQLQAATTPRALLLPDPLLDVRFAASSWLHTLRADCFDEVAFSAFYDSNVGQGLENVCGSGTDFRGPDGTPTAALAPGCGQ